MSVEGPRTMRTTENKMTNVRIGRDVPRKVYAGSTLVQRSLRVSEGRRGGLHTPSFPST